MSLAVELFVVSDRSRVGCKGPAAESWLADRGIAVPAGANRYQVSASSVLSARLATSEFLIEATDATAAAVVEPVRDSLERGEFPSGVYPVLRQDFALEISGPDAQALFLQTCAVDLSPIERQAAADAGAVVMTSMIGVSVVLVCRRMREDTRFTVWCDPSYREFFHSELQTLVGGMP